MEPIEYTLTTTKQSTTSSLPILQAPLDEGGFRGLIAMSLRLAVMNNRPGTLKVAHMTSGKATDVDLGYVPTDLSLVEGSDDSIVVGGPGGEICIVTAVEEAEGHFAATSHRMGLVEPVLRVAASNRDVVVLCRSGAVYHSEAVGDGYSPLTAVRPPVAKVQPLLTLHPDRRLIFVASKGTTVDVFDLATKKSMLDKPWSPHGDSLATAAHVFANKAVGPTLLLVTGAVSTTELRLWSYGPQGMVLSHELSIFAEDRAIIQPRVLCVDRNESCLLLPSIGETGVVVVLVTERGTFGKITEFELSAPGFAFSDGITRSSPRTQGDGYTVSQELTFLVRGERGYNLVAFDKRRTSDTSTAESVTKWFPGSMARATSASPSSVHTIVTSSYRGQVDKGPSAAAMERSAKSVLEQQMASGTSMLKKLEDCFQAIAHDASNTISALQAPAAVDEAKKRGQEFAQRNASRLQSNESVDGGAAELLQTLQSGMAPFIRESAASLYAAAAKRVVPTLNETLDLQLPNDDALMPKMAGVPSIQQFAQSLDKNNSHLIRTMRQKALAGNNKQSKLVSNVVESAGKATAAAKDYLGKLQAEVRGLRSDVEGLQRAAPSASRDSSYQLAIRLAETGQWNEAAAAIVEAPDITDVISFMELPTVCRDGVGLDPRLVTPVVFFALCRRLAARLSEGKGQIPRRIRLLHDCLTDWDEFRFDGTLSAAQIGAADAAASDQAKFIRDALEAVDGSQVDRESRGHMKVLRSLLKQYGA